MFVILARARQSEIQNLDAGLPDHDVAGLEIAMNDALGVRLDQRRHDLRGIQQRRFHRERSAFQPCRQRFALHQFHHQVVRPNVVERADVRVVQRGNRARLALETGAELLVSDLDGDGAAQSRVDRPKDLAHAAFAELAFDAVWTQARARSQCRRPRSSSSFGGVLDGGPIEEFAACAL